MGHLGFEKVGVGAGDAVPHHQTSEREGTETAVGRQARLLAGGTGEGGRGREGGRSGGRGKGGELLGGEKAWGGGAIEGDPVFVAGLEDERGGEVGVEGGVDGRGGGGVGGAEERGEGGGGGRVP